MFHIISSLGPFEILLPGTKLEVILDDAEVHLAVADHGEDRLGRDLGKLAEVLETHILQIELLLVDGGRGEEGRLDTLPEPLRREVAGVADVADVLHLVTGALGLAVAERDIAADLFPVLQFIGPGDLAVAQARPAGVEPKGLG